MTRRDDDKPEIDLPFEDPKGMFGTSPINKELTDEEVEYLTSRTAPRRRLTSSKRKIALYLSLFLFLLFFVRLIYFRTAPITGLEIPPVFAIGGIGMGETGILIACVLLPAINWFLITPEDASIRWMVRTIGTIVPLLLLALLFVIPAETVYHWTLPIYPAH